MISCEASEGTLCVFDYKLCLVEVKCRTLRDNLAGGIAWVDRSPEMLHDHGECITNLTRTNVNSTCRQECEARYETKPYVVNVEAENEMKH